MTMNFRTLNTGHTHHKKYFCFTMVEFELQLYTASENLKQKLYTSYTPTRRIKVKLKLENTNKKIPLTAIKQDMSTIHQ